MKDRNAQPLAYVYYENELGRRTAANLLTRDDARFSESGSEAKSQPNDALRRV